MPLFSKSHKNPAEIVKILKDNLAILEKQDKKTDKGKKDVTQIFNNILRRQIGTRSPTVEYISAHPHILFMLLKGYEAPQIALRCGIMLRECIRHEPLAKIILFSNQFRDFFKYVELSTFDIASDAFATFKDLLTRHKVLVADFLEQNYDTIFEDYEKLLQSENYVTKRQSLKLLGELILDRHNFAIMTKYISKPENLKLMMNLLRDKSPNIQFEAFHVFKCTSQHQIMVSTRSPQKNLCGTSQKYRMPDIHHRPAELASLGGVCGQSSQNTAYCGDSVKESAQTH
nr:calcium-binding protein 39-like isoform X3 [Macaca fascicularis]